MVQNRRKFISTIAVAGFTMPLILNVKPLLPTFGERTFPIRLFSKPLDSYDLDFMCDCVAGSGIGGFDLTVRKGGKIEPVNVERELPDLVQKAKRYNLSVDMIVTGILSADEPDTDKILRTASASGVKYYRLGWLEYDYNLGVWETIQKFRTSLMGILELNEKYKIHGGYQNHSGTWVGGPVWDLHELLRDFPPEFLGSQYDVRHATVEGASTWILGMNLIASHIKTLAIKDFTWKTVNGKPEAVTVPLGEGMVDWDLYFRTLKELGISVPITLHIEYPLLEPGDDKLSLIQQQKLIIGKLRKDVEFLNSYLKR
jgi:sugar phosphate isomerase/epimerase